MSYFVYILSNSRRTVFYTGLTNELKKRVLQHKSRLVPGFTKKYNCNELLYFEEYSMISEAIAREKALKKFPRHWKLQLIHSMNPELLDLSKDW